MTAMRTRTRSLKVTFALAPWTLACLAVACQSQDHEPSAANRPADSAPQDTLVVSSDAAPTDAERIAADAVSDARPESDARAESDALASGVDASLSDAELPVLPDAAPAPLELQTLAPRSCDLTLRFAAAPGTRSVLLAGDFTGWADAPLTMVGPDPQGQFSLTLSPADGLAPGATHAYKLIVDGEWRLDPGQTRQKFDGACVNSAFQMPDCAARPLLEGTRLEATPQGDLTAEVALRAAVQGAQRGAARFAIDGQRVAAEWSEARSAYLVTARGLDAGRYTLRVTAEDEDGRVATSLTLPFWVEARPFDWRSATLYMALIDRFADGDPSNNRPAPAADRLPRANDWHGGDLQGLRAALDAGYFDALGVNALWLSPVNTQSDRVHGGRDDPNQRFTAYHGYWPVSGRRVEPRFGGDAALRDFVRAAHRRGVRVLLDLVNNQVHEDHEYVAPHADWFRRGCVCGIDAGCGWSERPLDCLFAPYLPDINWRVPEAEAQFIADAEAWLEDFEVDGFRIDAVKHVETTAIYNLRDRLEARFGAPGAARVAMFGETAVGEGDRFDDGCGVRYDDGYAWVSAYAGATALDGQFDFPTHHRMQWGLLTGTLGFDAFEAIVQDAERRYADDAVHVRFLGSHDTNRMATRAARDPAADCRWPSAGVCEHLPGVVDDPAVYARLARAFAALYSLPGIPLLYMGDEVAQPGGGDPDNRRDMLVGAGLDGVRIGVTRPNAAQTRLLEQVGALGRARRDARAIGIGVRRALVAEADVLVVEWSAADAAALLVINQSAQPLTREVASAGWARGDAIAAGEGVLAPTEGGVRVSLPAGGFALWTR